ncbi:hypothetical protein BJ875DRAFT_385330 [Amylocarpus encephaloides]|uniref:F-box domain-containing protein n=1 Tax=Amylocarpus encephaloides TaxID=45428 RepID=A0A9P7YB19_9HELO|nr:hypothetical protein BJ875DRAFT_385330 [Amylocarpus encephaloides]
MATSTNAKPPLEKKPITILDLPAETQKEIFMHASSTDLIALSLVSRHFRDLAAEQIYRSFHIVFPDDDRAGIESPVDVLTAGLETFVGSEYNYARYLREVVLEPLSAGAKGEGAYRYYMHEQSYGKLINTLFLLLLRKAHSLETFRWDIRVELSRPVFKALHEISALQHLHLRMQLGHSTYQAPAPILASSTTGATHHHAVSLPPPPPPSMGPPPGFGLPAHSYLPPSFHFGSSTANQYATGSKNASKFQTKTPKALLPPLPMPSPTLSGFKNLRTLEILDMDTFDYIIELRSCIRNSSSTLSTLKVSFSEMLAKKSRKPTPEVHSDDESEVEDEFGQVIPLGPPPPGMPSSSSAETISKALKAQEEKKKQEEAFQMILGVASVKNLKSSQAAKHDADDKAESVSETKSKTDSKFEDRRLTLIKNLGPVAQKLMLYVKPGVDVTAESQNALDMIEQASKEYLDSLAKDKLPTKAPAESSTMVTPVTSTTSVDAVVENEVVMRDDVNSGPGLFDGPTEKKKSSPVDLGVSNPDDIDIEEPEGDELTSGLDLVATENEDLEESGETLPTQPNEPPSIPIEPKYPPSVVSPLFEEIAAFITEFTNRVGVSRTLREGPERQVAIKKETCLLRSRADELFASRMNPDNDAHTLASIESEIRSLHEKAVILKYEFDNWPEKAAAPAEDNSKMSEYVRNTRGLNLTTLALYLIPLPKPNVMSRGIDLSVLQDITLLNVGAQAPFWNHLAKENVASPLPLHKIYTDNVTLPFLGLVAQLENVTELLLLEKQKGRVESTALKTTVTIEQIRKVLKKHVSTLKVLLIKHDSNSEWDLNLKITMMLCIKAVNLEELSVTFSHKIVHTLLQSIPGMVSLRALHTNYFRQEDQCEWIKSNFGKFLVDTVSHSPQMQLEYVALGQQIERLVRRAKASPSHESNKKGKGKATDNYKVLSEMVLGSSLPWPDGSSINNHASSSNTASGAPYFDWQASSDDESEHGPVVGKLGLRIETVEGIRFSDVSGVRIFEKDVIGGRL